MSRPRALVCASHLAANHHSPRHNKLVGFPLDAYGKERLKQASFSLRVEAPESAQVAGAWTGRQQA